MASDTHAAEKVEVRYGVSLAVCYVRFPSKNVNNVAPTCPWCLKKLVEMYGLR